MPATRDDLVQLAHFLRQNPAAYAMTPEAIAEQTKISVESIRETLAAPAPSKKAPSRAIPGAYGWQRLRNLGQRLDQWIEKSERFTVLQVLLVWVLAGVATAVTNRIKGIDGSELIFLLSAFVIQMLLFYRHAKVKHALWSALSSWLLLSSLVALPLLSEASRLPAGPIVIWLSSVVGFALVSGVYAVLGSAAALLGAFYRFKRDDWTREGQTRQELLARLFQIEEALASGSTAEPIKPPSPVMEFLRLHQLWLSLVAGFFLSLTVVLLAGIGPSNPQTPRSTDTQGLLFSMLMLIYAALTLGVQFLISYVGGSIWGGIRNSLIYSLAGTGAVYSLAGMLDTGWLRLRNASVLETIGEPGAQLFGLIASLLVGTFCGMAAYVRRRQQESRLRQSNDPAMLVAEMIEIQRRLSPSADLVCVAVFDAAKSSQMKANADPLTAEWSFRAYQRFLQDIVEANQGRVHSTAGDGAVALFPSVAQAYRAAQLVQTRIGEFNQNVNRLRDPFRLRIGLHCDTVSGDLNEVQFAAVIDIAAHIEAASQVGGIACSDRVVAQLPEERFAALPERIDDHLVYIALQPQLES